MKCELGVRRKLKTYPHNRFLSNSTKDLLQGKLTTNPPRIKEEKGVLNQEELKMRAESKSVPNARLEQQYCAGAKQ